MIQIERIEEFLIKPDVQEQIHNLLKKCFSEYPGNRTYYKQLPDFRYLVWHEQQLIGHLAVEHRVMNNGNEVARIFGVVDICVDEDFQSQKTATTLLDELTILGQQNSIDFIVLFADQHDLYFNNGFQLVHNICRWLIINEHQTFGVGHRRIEDCLMVKPIGEKVWTKGVADFLGAVF